MDVAPRMPTLFVSHGTPLLLDEKRWVGELRAWAERLPRPRSILVVSGHWVEGKPTIGSVWGVPLLHDFERFPKRYYEVTYPFPPGRELNDRLKALLEPDVDHSVNRGLDSGAYVPIMAMYPAADIPVLQMSLSSLEVPPLVDMGRKLAPLRDEGVLIVASGVLVHNDRTLSFRAGELTPPWAKEFDAWITGVLGKRDAAALAGFRKAPGSRMAVPTAEHLLPVALALGASLGVQGEESVTFPVTGFAYGSLSRRSVQFG